MLRKSNGSNDLLTKLLTIKYVDGLCAGVLDSRGGRRCALVHQHCHNLWLRHVLRVFSCATNVDHYEAFLPWGLPSLQISSQRSGGKNGVDGALTPLELLHMVNLELALWLMHFGAESS